MELAFFGSVGAKPLLTEYVFVDGHGNEVSEAMSAKATLSSCYPVYDGEHVA